MLYGTTVDWISYAAARGNSAPGEAATADADAALQRASDYIRRNYVKLNPELTAENADVQEATYIAATLELATPGFFSRTYAPSQTKVLTEVKGIKWQPLGGSTGSVHDMVPVSTDIEMLLKSQTIPLPGFMAIR